MIWCQTPRILNSKFQAKSRNPTSSLLYGKKIHKLIHDFRAPYFRKVKMMTTAVVELWSMLTFSSSSQSLVVDRFYRQVKELKSIRGEVDYLLWFLFCVYLIIALFMLQTTEGSSPFLMDFEKCVPALDGHLSRALCLMGYQNEIYNVGPKTRCNPNRKGGTGNS